jgi:hypothetical protein
VLCFTQVEWIALTDPASVFDLNGDATIDFADSVKVFVEMDGNEGKIMFAGE